jgi:hypothetical protein
LLVIYSLQTLKQLPNNWVTEMSKLSQSVPRVGIIGVPYDAGSMGTKVEKGQMRGIARMTERPEVFGEVGRFVAIALATFPTKDNYVSQVEKPLDLVVEARCS